MIKSGIMGAAIAIFLGVLVFIWLQKRKTM